jgi:23S rRNA pseudouridine1911/1915/1917 synthase
MRSSSQLRVLFEDNHLLAVVKPPGIATQGAAAGKPSLVSQAKEYLRQKYRKPGNVYLGVVSRLDSSTSGVVIFARTSKAAARLSEQFRERRVEKTYWALLEGTVEPAAAELVDFVAKDERQQRMIVVPQHSAASQEARLSYCRLKRFDRVSLVEVSLETGRKHQIRLQFAARKHPVVGDRKYGSKQPFAAGIALHCRRLVIEHPVKKTPLELIAPPPRAWREFKVE